MLSSIELLFKVRLLVIYSNYISNFLSHQLLFFFFAFISYTYQPINSSLLTTESIRSFEHVLTTTCFLLFYHLLPLYLIVVKLVMAEIHLTKFLYLLLHIDHTRLLKLFSLSIIHSLSY